jgi:putative ABC transport system ATP-binding protein
MPSEIVRQPNSFAEWSNEPVELYVGALKPKIKCNPLLIRIEFRFNARLNLPHPCPLPLKRERAIGRPSSILKAGLVDPSHRSVPVTLLENVRPSIAPVIALRDINKIYPSPSSAFSALADINLSIQKGEFVAIVGQSGSGKSTLLSLLAGIDRPSSGEVVVDGQAVHALSEKALSAWRGRSIGIVFQFFQLLPTLTTAENVMLPMDFGDRWPMRERRSRALALLDRLGVVEQADKLPAALSGGQQQRVAVARALANAPAILLADEPTGNLDSRSSESLLTLLADLVRDGQTVVMVTHEQAAIRHATRTVTLADGRIVQNEAANADRSGPQTSLRADRFPSLASAGEGKGGGD